MKNKKIKKVWNTRSILLEWMDWKATGEWLYIPEGVQWIYFQKEYSFNCKSILSGRATFESDFNEPIHLSKIKDSKIEKKDFVAEKKKWIL